MLRLLIFVVLLLAPGLAEARVNAIQPELVAEGPAVPGGEVELAILMHTRPGWHGYWENPGDAGQPMAVEWQLPPGFSVGELRYPLPTRLTISNLMNYVYERDFAVLVRLKVPPGVTGQVPIRATARWLACTEEICVPEQGEFSLSVPTGGLASMDSRFNEWRRAVPRPLATPAHYAFQGGRLLVAVPLPADVPVREPYLFPSTSNIVDYDQPQSFRRTGDWLVAELPATARPGQRFDGVLDYGGSQGLAFHAVPGVVPGGGATIVETGWQTVLWAVLGALVGGMLLNLMPCVFPILGLKALHLSRLGGEARGARSDALAYAAGAIVGTGMLGVILLCIRAAGADAGWAFQLQDPRTVLVLLLLATAITANLLGLFELPVLGGGVQPAGSFGTGALAAFVATPCAGPFLGAALGAALLLPAAGSVAVFAALGLGLALPFLALAFIPWLRNRMPRPGPWMERLKRFLAIPMAVSAAAALWLLYRLAGRDGLVLGSATSFGLLLILWFLGRRQPGRSAAGWAAGLAALALAAAGSAFMPPPVGSTKQALAGVEAWSQDRVADYVRQGRPVFVYFTADWCLTCKANEAAAIDRAEVRRAFNAAGVKVLAGDWTNGNPAITRFLESRGRAGVPLYLWYAPGEAPEELPQILTPGMLTSRARAARR